MYGSLKDVAARAGVSFQTASKALNGHPGVVSERTRRRILRAADEMGYVPNALARGLVRQTSGTIGILVEDFADPALSQFVKAAERAAGSTGACRPDRHRTRTAMTPRWPSGRWRSSASAGSW